jgi:hypothetical protein
MGSRGAVAKVARFSGRCGRKQVDFEVINATTRAVLPVVLERWLPGGRWVGREYVVKNPRRADRTPGSFKISRDGPWADFATGDRGGDIISLAAYLAGCSQSEAARQLAEMLGVD